MTPGSSATTNASTDLSITSSASFKKKREREKNEETKRPSGGQSIDTERKCKESST